MTDLVLRSDPLPGVALITLNRPDKRNALNIPLVEQLCAHLDAVHADKSNRVIILAGAGQAFCAGLDLTEALDPSKSHQSAELVSSALCTLMSSPRVTIAAAHGAAVAGGAGFMLACDFIVAADDLKLGFPEVRRGLVAAFVMTFLRRKMPESLARELLLTGELIDARRALAYGLVNRVVPRESVTDEALALARLARLGAPGAMAETKRLFDSLWDAPVDKHLDLAHALHQSMRSTAEAAEGLAAFREKRRPSWDLGA
jgi:methylglutaconyl-CoA hydratase